MNSPKFQEHTDRGLSPPKLLVLTAISWYLENKFVSRWALPSLNQGVPRQTLSLLLLKRQRTVSNIKKREENKTTHRTKMPGCPRQTFFCSWKGTKISAERDVDSHVSRLKLEKALKSVLRQMPSGTFLLGNLKNSGWTVIGPWTAIGEWTATANRSSSLLLRYDRAHGPITVFRTAYRAVDRYRGRAGYRVPHIGSASALPIIKARFFQRGGL